MSSPASSPNPSGTYLVVNASQMVTCAGPARPRTGPELRELGIIPDGAMLVRNGVIAAVGTREEIARLHPADLPAIDAGGRVVMPGFVDAHTHLIFAGNRADEFEQRCAGATYQEIAAAGGGIRSTVRKTRAADDQDLQRAGMRYATWFLRGGTTTVEAKSGYGLSLEHELKILQAIRAVETHSPLRCVPTFLGAHDTPQEYAGRSEEYAEYVIHEMLPAVSASGLARFCDVFCEPMAFPVPIARRILVAAREHGLGLRLHADQFECSGAALLAAELHTATADHLEHVDPAGIRALAASGVQPVLLPGSVYAIGSARYAPARAMIHAGLAVVLATDFNPGSSPTTSMSMVLSLACTQMKMTPAESILASTVNAAYSLGLGSSIGSLEPGKVADFVVQDAEDYREIPYFFGGQIPAWFSRAACGCIDFRFSAPCHRIEWRYALRHGRAYAHRPAPK